MLVKACRNGAGYIIVFLDWISRPKGQTRSSQEQEKVQQSIQGLTLYQLYACPFCIRTRRAIHELNVKIAIRDIGKDKASRAELEMGGGRVKVPCLRIEDGNETRWMYESKDIIKFLRRRTTLN